MLYRFEQKLYQKYAKNIDPSIAQLVERRTVVGISKADILRSLVRIRFEGIFCQSFSITVNLLTITIGYQKQK